MQFFHIQIRGIYLSKKILYQCFVVVLLCLQKSVFSKFASIRLILKAMFSDYP